MNFIGDYFAIGLVIVLCMFYFESKYFLTTASKYFVACLLLTAATAATDIASGMLLDAADIPYWINMVVNSLYFIINIFTTSAIALFLFTKILEHAYDDHCMVYARRGLLILFSVYLLLVLGNLRTGWMFWFDADGTYQRGPLNAAGYIVTVCQMILVLLCFCRNRKNASRSMRRALIQTFPVVVLCIIIQRIYPEIMLNSFIMSMMDTVLFLTFQGQHQGIHTLTKLNDRHRFFRDTELRTAAGKPFHLFLINLQNFGVINQKYGNLRGDEILYQCAFALEKLRKNSMAFHMNGTVFALSIPYNGPQAAEEHRQALLHFLETGIHCFGEQVFIDYTMAECIAGDEECSSSEYFEKLEYAAALAHSQNRHYIFCTADLTRQMHRRRYLIDRLQTIDRAHGYQVWYQPVHCEREDVFCSMEALIRLYEPDGTIISPGEFIPLAEETGAINALTWFVIDEVCRFLAEKPQLNPVSVSINLPMAQLLERDFAAHLCRITDRWGISHHRICLEFTERAILDTFEKTKDTMEKLTLDGFRFYLDDFGTGYSNFNCLLQLPFQFIKLDSSLIHHPAGMRNRQGLIGTLTRLFHDMNLKVIAEGAETAGEVRMLKEFGVDRIQGYFFARPMPPEDILDFYRQNPHAR